MTATDGGKSIRQAELRENTPFYVCSERVNLLEQAPRPLILVRRQTICDCVKCSDGLNEVAPDPEFVAGIGHVGSLAAR